LSVFVDTSALYAFVDADDAHHLRARTAFARLVAADELVTHAYAVSELISLVHRRMGADAVRRLVGDVLPLLATVFVDETTHDKCLTAFMAALPARTSFVDAVSFHVMRERSIRMAFTFDADFAREGFDTVP